MKVSMTPEESIQRFVENNWRESYQIFETIEGQQLMTLFRRKVPQNHKYYKRLVKEFNLVIQKNFSKVFFQVQEILDLVGNDIPHIIRGSAGSSLICYLMKITNIDPVKENISLARFLHSYRQDYPDIDIDFPWNYRDLIFKKITDRWENQVARISNHIYYKPKSALRQAIREHGYRKFVPKDFELSDIFPNPTIQKKIMAQAKKLEGTMKCHSLHCGGIIIFSFLI